MRSGVVDINTLQPHDGQCGTCGGAGRTTFTGKARPFTIDCPRCRRR